MERNRIEKEYKSKSIFRGVASAAVLQALISLKPPLFTPPAFSQAVRVCTWSIHHSWSGCDQGGTSHILFPLMIMKFFTFAICKSFIFVTWFQESMSIMFLFFSFFLPFFFWELYSILSKVLLYTQIYRDYGPQRRRRMTGNQFAMSR